MLKVLTVEIPTLGSFDHTISDTDVYIFPLTMGNVTQNLISQCFPSFYANTSFSKK